MGICSILNRNIEAVKLFKELIDKSIREQVEYAVLFDIVDDKFIPIKTARGVKGEVSWIISVGEKTGIFHTHPEREEAGLSLEDMLTNIGKVRYLCAGSDREVICMEYIDHDKIREALEDDIEEYYKRADELDSFFETAEENLVDIELSEKYEELEDKYMEARNNLIEKFYKLGEEGRILSICKFRIPDDDNNTESNIIIKPPGIYYHGAPASRVEQIEKTGYLIPAPPEHFKGTREEQGLIWVTDKLDVARYHALSYEDKPGAVYKVEIPFTIYAISYNTRLIDRQAEILNNINLRREYDPIEPGITFDSAVYKIIQHVKAPQTLREILPLIGCNAIQDAGGYGVIADQLRIVE